MSQVEQRQRLADRQAELIRALAAEGPVPVGFDADRIAAAAASLARKRLKEAAHAWPALAGALAEEFARHFRTFAEQVPLPHIGGPLADGRAFARYLAARDLLPDEGRIEALRVDLHHATTRAGLVPRRGPALRMARLRQARRIVLAVRLPFLRDWWISWPLPFRGRRSDQLPSGRQAVPQVGRPVTSPR